MRARARACVKTMVEPLHACLSRVNMDTSDPIRFLNGIDLYLPCNPYVLCIYGIYKSGKRMSVCLPHNRYVGLDLYYVRIHYIMHYPAYYEAPCQNKTISSHGVSFYNYHS